MECVRRVAPRTAQIAGGEADEHTRLTRPSRLALNRVENLVNRQHLSTSSILTPYGQTDLLHEADLNDLPQRQKFSGQKPALTFTSSTSTANHRRGNSSRSHIDANRFLDFVSTRSPVFKERPLPTSKKEAIDLMMQNPNLIRRPILIKGSKVIFGFDKDDYAKL